MRLSFYNRAAQFLAGLIDSLAGLLLVVFDFLLEVIGTLILNSGMGVGIWIFTGLWIIARALRDHADVQADVLQGIRADANAVALRREIQENTAIQKRIVKGLVEGGYLDDGGCLDDDDEEPAS